MIFDKNLKHLLEKINGDHQKALHQFADQLNWVSEDFDKANTWLKQQHNEILWACHCVGTVEFSMPKEPLAKCYQEVTKDLTHRANGGYLDWVVL